MIDRRCCSFAEPFVGAAIYFHPQQEKQQQQPDTHWKVLMGGRQLAEGSSSSRVDNECAAGGNALERKRTGFIVWINQSSESHQICDVVPHFSNVRTFSHLSRV